MRKSADVPYSISETHVRFYRDSDREQAERLARALGVSARDFSERTGSASDGIVELWLSGSGAAPRRASATRGQSAARASAPSFAGADGNGASGVLSAITGALSAFGSGAGRRAASDDGRDATNGTGPALRPVEGSPGKRKAYGRKAGKGKGSNKGGNGKSHGNNGNSGKGGGKKH